jgi:predicted RND superfamily exporter protein
VIKSLVVPKAKKSAGSSRDLRKILGGIIIGTSIFFFAIMLIGFLSYAGSKLFSGLGLAFIVGLLAIVGGTLISKANKDKKKKERFEKYMDVIGDKPWMPISMLEEAVGEPFATVYSDLREMLSQGLLYGGEIDVQHRRIVFPARDPGSWNGPDPPKKKPTGKPQTVITPSSPKEDDSYASTIRQIKELNDRIKDEQMSRKIDRIQDLTQKIFDQIKSDPEHENKTRKFMNYYLPTTLKLLDAYSRYEALGVRGENIDQAMSNIENTMDTVLQGFEKQLDELYGADTMDVSADISVLEGMMAGDGLTAKQDFPTL